MGCYLSSSSSSPLMILLSADKSLTEKNFIHLVKQLLHCVFINNTSSQHPCDTSLTFNDFQQKKAPFYYWKSLNGLKVFAPPTEFVSYSFTIHFPKLIISYMFFLQISPPKAACIKKGLRFLRLLRLRPLVRAGFINTRTSLRKSLAG